MKNWKGVMIAVLAVLTVLVFVAPVFSAVPGQISYQGMLTDDTGQPVADDNYAMTFAIYTAASGGTAMWSEAQTVPVSGGVYNVILGQPGNEIDPADMDGERYLGVTVGSDDEMTPRQPITASAFALRSALADDADTLDGMDASAFGDISGVTAGTGLSGGGTSGTVTVSANFGGSGVASTISRSDHYHPFSDLTGTASDAQIPNTITISHAATAGDADTLDGFHSGAFAQAAHNHSATQIVSGTLSTSRFSAYSDLYSEGYLANASGDIAQNNGTLQVNLNADLLDGQQASAFIKSSSSFQTVYGVLKVDASGVADDYGVWALGTYSGGYFEDSNGTGWALVGRQDNGINAYGTAAGGYFADSNGSGRAYVGYGDRGIWAKGDFAGGTFSSTDNTTYWADVSTSTHKILGTGTVSFVQNHPYDENTVIVYAAPEGDEVAVYTRGTARLVDGEARVVLGETFQYVANPDIGLTVYLTPVGGWSDLYLAEKSTESILVRSAGGAANAAFDYIVYGLRLGFEEAAVLQPKEKDALLPTAEAIEVGYGDRPDLRAFNAMARYREMHAAVDPSEEIDLSQTRELASALEDQRSAALARAAACQEGMRANEEKSDGDGPRPSSGRPDHVSDAAAADALPVRVLIAELRSEIAALRSKIAAFEAGK